MPIAPTITMHREEILAVVADKRHLHHLRSDFFERSYFNTDAAGQIIVRPGMILAVDGNSGNSNTTKYVPYSASASYGPSSGTPVGVLEVIQDLTYDELMIEPIWHGLLIEDHCYVYGQSGLGSIPAAVKTVLDDIEWV